MRNWFILTVCLLASCSLIQAKEPRRAEVLIETSMGNIVVELYNETPLHRDRFLDTVKRGKYNGVIFHRVIKDFMIQGGDLTSKNPVPGKLYGDGKEDVEETRAEFRYPEIFHRRGVLAAAREGDDVNPLQKSSAYQFYIVWGKVFDHDGIEAMKKRLSNRMTNPVEMTDEVMEAYTTVGGTPHLDGAYTVYGEVKEGLDVVDAIQQVRTDRNDRPLEDIFIKKAKIIRKWK